MEDIYKKLAIFLDRLPGGYPATESGVEIRILKNLFTKEEAELTMSLSLKPETPSKIAARLNRDASVLADTLEAMAQKGLIFRVRANPENLYMATNFVIGIWEFQLNRLNMELIKDVDEYMPHLLLSMKGHNTKQIRVIPVSKSISNDLSIMPYDEAKKIIRSQTKIVASPCICRREQKMAGKGCDSPDNNCLSFSFSADFFEINGLGRQITQDDAIKLLDEAAEAGLVLQPTNAQNPTSICLCCGCCCGILRNIKKLENPGKFVNSNYYSQVVKDDCTSCGVCVDMCPMNAITMDEFASVNVDRCIGCGVCVAHCGSDAIRLVKKEQVETPPANIVETFGKILKERGLA
jgi:ferredoxin/predicted transcriptional regulator